MTSTATLRATTTLPSTKPILRIFQDAMRAAVSRPGPDGRKRIFHIADALALKAMEGDVAAIREVADRLDGKAQVQPGDDGLLSLSFVVRLPHQLDADEWQNMVNPRPARILDASAVDSAQAGSASDPELAVELADPPIADPPA